MDYFDFPLELPDELLPLPKKGGKRAKMEQLREGASAGNPEAIKKLEATKAVQKQQSSKNKEYHVAYSKKYDQDPARKELKNQRARERRAIKRAQHNQPPSAK